MHVSPKTSKTWDDDPPATKSVYENVSERTWIQSKSFLFNRNSPTAWSKKGFNLIHLTPPLISAELTSYLDFSSCGVRTADQAFKDCLAKDNHSVNSGTDSN